MGELDMANAVGFEGANDRLLAPKGDKNCRDLEIHRTEKSIISCWRLTDEELKKVAETGVVWFMVVGQTHPPILVSGDALVLWNGKPAKAEPYIPPARIGGAI